MIFFYRIEEDFSLKMISLMQKLTLYFFQGGLIIMSSSKTRFFNPAVVGLIMLSFFLGTSEYTVIGILPEIADGFGISLNLRPETLYLCLPLPMAWALRFWLPMWENTTVFVLPCWESHCLRSAI